jgi:DNA-binding XRE family transcriptional regulator
VNKPVRTTTPGGEEIVILPAAEYDRLLDLAEDARDLAIAEKALSEFRSGKGESLDQAEMLELLDARTPLAFWRRRRGLTQSALAAAVGISQAYLAQIEKGKRVGDLHLYRRLSEALRLEMEDLAPPEDGAAVPMSRRRLRNGKPARKA